MRSRNLRPNRSVVSWLATVALVVSGIGASGEPPSSTARLEVGRPAPELELSSSTGTTFRLSDLTGAKSAVLIFFRGSW